MNMDYSLYLVTDESVPTDQLLRVVGEAVEGGVTLVQLREKRSEGKIFYEKALKLKQFLKENYAHIPLIINDRVDIALAVEADGVHIGQKDIPVTAVRKIVPESMIVGVSVSNVTEAKETEKNGADYLGVGAVYPTTTKDNAEHLPEGMLEEIAKTVTIPVVAIGGLKVDNLEKVRCENVHGIAVVSGIMHAENPKEAAGAYRKSWGA